MTRIQRLGLPIIALAIGASAKASIIYFPAQNIPIPTNFAGVSVDLETGLVSNDLDGLPDGDANFFFGGAEISNDADVAGTSATWQPVRTGTGNTDPVAKLTVDVTTVGPGSTYATDYGSSGDVSSHFTTGGGEVTAGQQTYLGFSLDPNSGSGGPWYGWMLVTLNDNDAPGTIHAWAFDDTGAPILVGAIPEPSSAALALLGLGAFALRRRRP